MHPLKSQGDPKTRLCLLCESLTQRHAKKRSCELDWAFFTTRGCFTSMIQGKIAQFIVQHVT